jgi:hypothetical protein
VARQQPTCWSERSASKPTPAVRRSAADDYDRIRDTMARVLDGFKDFNARVRRPHGFRLSQPARKRGFLTPSGRAEFGLAPLPDDVDPGEGRLTLATIRSHDQFNTTIYSNDDRYRGLTGLRTVVLMNPDDMRDRGLDEFDLIDITSFSRDGTTRAVYGYRAVRYDIARGCAAGYMPELNVLCGIADHSTLRPGEASSCRTSLAAPRGTRSAGPRYRTARPLPARLAASEPVVGNHGPFGRKIFFPDDQWYLHQDLGGWCGVARGRLPAALAAATHHHGYLTYRGGYSPGLDRGGCL